MGLSFEHDRQEWNTLTQSLPARRSRWNFSAGISSAIHLLALIALCWTAGPVFVKPALLARGEGGSATPSSVVLYVPRDLEIASASKPALLSLPVPEHKKVQKIKLRKRNNVIEEADKTPNAAEVGSENGSAYDGLATGDEVKPA